MFRLFFVLLAVVVPLSAFSEGESSSSSLYGACKVTGDKVNLRMSPDLSSAIVRKLSTGYLLDIIGEEGGFFKVSPLPHMKMYVYRKYVNVGSIEGESVKGTINSSSVNVRLDQPNMSAPVITVLSSGSSISGKICSSDSDWLEISSPQGTCFYVAKEYISKAGIPKFATKAIGGEEQSPSPSKSVTSASPTSSPSSSKLIVHTSGEKTYVQKSPDAESKPTEKKSLPSSPKIVSSKSIPNLSSEMKAWIAIEKSVSEVCAWQKENPGKDIYEYYREQELFSKPLTGIIVPYDEPVKNKPGDFKLLDSNKKVVAYLYSTNLNLRDSKYLGQEVTIKCLPRDNRSFAYPAYCVISASVK